MSGSHSGRINLFGLLFRQAPNRMFVAILLDTFHGIAYAAIIPLVLGSVQASLSQFPAQEVSPVTFLWFEVAHQRYAALFAAMVVLILIARATSRMLLELIASNVTAELRLDMYRRLVQAPVAVVERTGPARIMAVLAEDVPRIIAAGRHFPVMLSNLATLAGMLSYLAYLNRDAFYLVIQALVIGAVTYQVPVMIGLRFLRRKREIVDKLHGSMQALLNGFKELKLDPRKRSSFFTDDLYRHEHGVRDADKAGQAIVIVASTYGELINFFVIGIISFVFVNYHAISTEELIAVIMTLLYITAPIALMLQAIPHYMSSGVSLKKVNQLFQDMPVESASPVCQPPVAWSSIRFQDVSYRHHADARDGYKVGPVSFEIVKGQVTFIVGGNGSGKSTLGKLITLHYPAETGEIHFGAVRISDATINTYRQHIACIYSDYYVFERLLNNSGADTHSEVNRYLRELGLDAQVTFENGRFSNLELSDGQRRRLALLVALLESKDLYLFDEWAADQDPVFKEVFYHQILTDLKRKGRAVVVISHDDRYFHLADRLLFMENGQLVENQDPAAWRHTSGAMEPAGPMVSSL